MPKIRFIIKNIYSKRDAYGNTYWMSVVRSTISGNTFRFRTPHESNTNVIMRQLAEWDEMDLVNIEVPKREFKRLVDDPDVYSGAYEEEILSNIVALE